MRRRGTRAAAWLAAALVLAGAAGAARAEDAFRVRIATGSEGGTFHAVGEALAEVIRHSPSLLEATAEPSLGSVQNVRRLLAGEVEFALVQADVLYNSRNDGQPGKRLRAVTAVMPELVHVIVRQDSDVRTFEDLLGRRVLAGRPGSGMARTFDVLLEAHRMKPADVDRLYLDPKDAGGWLLNSDLEAWVPTYAAPTPLVTRLFESGQVRLVPLAGDLLSSLAEHSPAIRAGIIPKGTYPGQEVDVPTAVVRTVLVTREDVDPVIVSEVMRLFLDEVEQLRKAHPLVGTLPLKETANDLPVPLHDGAIAVLQARTELERPVKVHTGVFVVDVSNLDLKNGTCEADFYVWFRWQGQHLQAADEGFPFELMNGTINDKSDPVMERLGTWSYIVYRCRATLRGRFPLQHYPFDTQTLQISLESPEATYDEMVFVPDERKQFAENLRERSVDQGVAISDWVITGVRQRADVKVYKTDFGSPEEEAAGASKYSRYVFEMDIQRVLLPYVVKFVVPLIVIVLMSFCVFFIHPQEFEVQAGIVITALLSCVAFHLTQADALPEVGYLVTADKFFLLSYVTIFLALVEVVAENYYFHRGEIERAHRIDLVSRVVFPIIFFAPLLYLVYEGL